MGRLAAEAFGTAVLAAVLIGSGVRAAALSGDAGVGLVANVLPSVLALAVLLTVLGPVSGGHLNPLVSLAAWWTGRRRGGGGLPGRELPAYAAAQLTGAVAGAALANAMYGRPLLEAAAQRRTGGALWLSEAVATGVLVLLVSAPVRDGRAGSVPLVAAGWVGAACWATSSGGFANPALTAARSLSDTYAGIAPGSVPGFVVAQTAGAVLGLASGGLLLRTPRAGQVARKDFARSRASSSASTSPGRLPLPRSTPPQRIPR